MSHRGTWAKWAGEASLAAVVAFGLAGLGCAAETADRESRQSAPVDVQSSTLGTCSDGQQRSCHETIGQHGNVTTCVDGMQTCEGGEWGPCTEVTFSAMVVQTDQGATWTTTTLGASDPCASNACDPTCESFVETPDPSITATSTELEGGGSFGSLPGGQQQKLRKEPCNAPENCTDGPYCYAACQADSHCNLSTGQCDEYAQGETQPADHCAGADLTVGVPCDETGTSVPVCNRGNAPSSGQVQVHVYPGNSPNLQVDLNTLPFGAPVSVDCSTNAPIQPGECVMLSCPVGNGYKSLAVNPNNTVTECRRNNNWSGHIGSMTCETTFGFETSVYKKSYTASCPTGSVPQWGFLTYTIDAPSNASGASSVKIEAQTAVSEADLDPTCADCVTLADTAPPASDPLICHYLPSSASCPVSLYEEIGVPFNHAPTIELTFTLMPTPDKVAAPTVDDWTLTYSCVPFE